MSDTNLVIGGKEFSSRLIVGTGKYASMDVMKRAHEASGAQIVTVALRRVSLPSGESILDHLDTTRYTLLPNTAGCYTADEAIRTCYLAREAGLGEMVKLEVIGDPRTLFPDVFGLLEATKTLAREGFTVMPYTNDDPVMAKKLEDAGAAVVMPLGAPIGSGLGIRNPYNIKIILETVSVPVIVDAGVGTASDAAIAMELGCEGVLMNTAISGAQDPVDMARALRLGVEAGRLAFKAGRIGKKLYATASSPLEGVPDWTSCSSVSSLTVPRRTAAISPRSWASAWRRACPPSRSARRISARPILPSCAGASARSPKTGRRS
jgi:thiazole synthase